MKLKTRFFRPKIIFPVISTVLVIVAWLLFAPAQFGGQVSFIIINGNSMEPLLHKGDLVLVQTQAEVGIGDIVTYSYPGIGPVIHRIIDREADRYVLQGDNNSWVDGYQPVKNDIIGKYWFSLPKIGKTFMSLRTPWVFALFAGFSTFIIGVSMLKLPGKKKNVSIINIILRKMGFNLIKWKDNYWFLVYFLAVAFLVLGVVSFLKPLQKTVSDELIYTQEGVFSYSGSASQNVYDTNSIQSGDPIYTSLTCVANYGFDYQLVSTPSFNGGGTYQIVAELESPNGWHRTISQTEMIPFSGNMFHGESSLNLCDINAYLESLNEVTGVQLAQYTLNIIPNVVVSGEIMGRTLNTEFSPSLSFVLNDKQVYLSSAITEENNPLRISEDGLLSQDKIVPNTLTILGVSLPINTARTISLTGLLVSLIGMIIPVFVLRNAEQNDEKMRAKLLIGQMMVETRQSPVNMSDKLVELSTFEDLVLFAERSESVILFYQQAMFVDYFVRKESILYRFRQFHRRPQLERESETFREDILHAIEHGELVLFYQPGVSLQSGKITRVEALLRWQHPTRGLLMPMQFLPQAEESDAISWIDSWVLQNACKQLSKWREFETGNVVLAINISAYQLRNPRLVTMVKDALLDNQLPAANLQLEISQDQISFDPVTLNNLKKLKFLGINISINSTTEDDLVKLGRITEVGQFKIGQKVVQQVHSDARQKNEATQMISLAHERKLNVTAVGVETPEQLGFFRLNACDEAQGYFISPPLPAEEMTELVRKGGRLIEL